MFGDNKKDSIIVIFFTLIVGLGAFNKTLGTYLEMPLVGNDDIPLVAKLDTTKINKALKLYINLTTEITMKEQIRSLKRDVVDEILNSKYPRDCEDIKNKISGIYRIYPIDPRGFDVYCDMQQENGDWTVIQRRLNGSVKFYRNWNDYKSGFGNIDGEFWLGNSHIHAITSRDEYELLIKLEDLEGEKRYAQYKSFDVGGPVSKYKLTIKEYSGNAGDAMAYHNGSPFSAKGRDMTGNHDCVKKFKGGWWYKSCHHSNLNGLYLNGTHTSFADGIEWYQWTDYRYSLAKTEMLIRRRR